MARALVDIERDILALSQKERTELLRKLIDDLDAPRDANSEAAWLKESERRLDEIENGTARTFPADDVMKDARTLLK
jgi:putative addiction module component (TIGR02574 family)